LAGDNVRVYDAGLSDPRTRRLYEIAIDFSSLARKREPVLLVSASLFFGFDIGLDNQW
jgi:hypothetical protein